MSRNRSMDACLFHVCRVGSLMLCLAVFAHCLPGQEANTGAFPSSVPTSDQNNTQSVGGAASPNTAADGISNTAGAQGSMTIAPASAPDLCLAVVGNNVSAATLVLRLCDASLAQRWVLVNGMLQSAGGLCLTLDSNAVADASNVSVSPCDTNNASQLTVWQGGRFNIATPSINFSLQFDRAPPTTRSVVQFGAFDLNKPQQLWSVGQYSHDDTQKVIQGGTHIVPLNARASCLTANDVNAVSQQCNAADPNQAWELTSDGHLRNRAKCLRLNEGAPTMVACTTTDTKQLLGFSQGIMFNSTTGCLVQDANASGALTTAPCDFTSNQKWVVGLSQ